MSEANVGPVFDAVLALRVQGVDAKTTAGFFLNAGALLVGNAMDEAGFVEFARQSWRAGKRQEQLVDLLGRVLPPVRVAGKQTSPGVRTPRRKKAKATS